MLPYDEAGSGDPVVLIHAGVADRTMWRETLGALATAGYRAIAPDLPGFGEAPVQAGRHAPWEDVLHTMRELELPGAHLVGISFGAAVALRVGVLAPASTWSLLLASPAAPGAEPSATLEAAWAEEEAASERGDIAAAVDAILAAWTLPDVEPGVRERVRGMAQRALELQAGAPETETAPDPLVRNPEALAELDIPVLTLAGEHDMPDFHDGAEQLAQAIPGARNVVLAEAGHLAPLEVSDAFISLLLEFLDVAATTRG